MMLGVMNVTIRTSTEGQAISPRIYVRPVDRMIAELFGWEDSPQLTGLRIHTITLTGESLTQDPSNPSLMIEGRVARIRHEDTDTISYWIDDHGKWVWDDWSLRGDWHRISD